MRARHGDTSREPRPAHKAAENRALRLVGSSTSQCAPSAGYPAPSELRTKRKGLLIVTYPSEPTVSELHLSQHVPQERGQCRGRRPSAGHEDNSRPAAGSYRRGGSRVSSIYPQRAGIHPVSGCIRLIVRGSLAAARRFAARHGAAYSAARPVATGSLLPGVRVSSVGQVGLTSLVRRAAASSHARSAASMNGETADAPLDMPRTFGM